MRRKGLDFALLSHPLDSMRPSSQICSRLVSSEVLKICTHNNFRNREFGRIKFHASGREDMDVRMLSISGSGRPFVVEITDSSKVPNSDELRNIESFICGGSSAGSSEDYGDGGGGVGVMGLRLVGRNDFGGLQRETEDKVSRPPLFVCALLSVLLLLMKKLRKSNAESSDGADSKQSSFLTLRQ